MLFFISFECPLYVKKTKQRNLEPTTIPLVRNMLVVYNFFPALQQRAHKYFDRSKYWRCKRDTLGLMIWIVWFCKCPNQVTLLEERWNVHVWRNCRQTLGSGLASLLLLCLARRAGFQSRRLRPALPCPAHWDKIRTQCEPHTPSLPPPLLKQSS